MSIQGENGQWSMSGERKVLVSTSSATHCRPWEDTNDHMCPMQRDHSNLVKFSPHDHGYDTVLHVLQGMVQRAAHCQERRITHLEPLPGESQAGKED